jgi:hypothetical protein
MDIELAKKTVCLDFDGCIHKMKGWGDDEGDITGTLIDGAKEAIEDLRSDYKVVIYSVRCRTKKGRDGIAKFLSDNEIEVDGIESDKPAAFCFLDDRAITFKGNWKTAVKNIRGFKWWLEGKSKDQPTPKKSYDPFDSLFRNFGI